MNKGQGLSSRDIVEAEEWRDLEGYDYKYQVSNLGRVRRLKRYPRKGDSVYRTFKGSADKKGYLRVVLIRDKKPYTAKIHRLVSKLFLPGFTEDITVNHKDFDKSNNRVSNLENVSVAENIRHYQEAYKRKRGAKRVGVMFHRGIQKWLCRVTYMGKRYSLGVFPSEGEASDTLEKFKRTKDESMLSIGKGSKNVGKRKYTESERIEALWVARSVGVRKASKATGMGTTTISALRREYEFVNGEYRRKQT